jgi:hypothetical protein
MITRLKSWLSWRPALPGFFMSGLSLVGRAAKALWRSFWAVWGRPMTYPIVGVVAVGMFVLGHVEGRRGAEVVRQTLIDVRAERDELRVKVGAAEINEQAARKAGKDALDKVARLEARIAELEKPKPAPAPAPVRRAPVPAKPAGKPFTLFGGAS